MNSLIEKLDETTLDFFKKITSPLSRISLFIIFFWFGSLKIIDVSPANPLVEALLKKTLPFIGFNQFIVFLGIWEIIIGITFLIPKLERIAISLLIPHMITTFMPLVFLPSIAWKSFLIPTLEGQYIIKNLLIIALAVNIVSRIKSAK